ncbi:MAG: CoA pyrophosphatase [Candidatus Caldarchaeum sp.]
METTNGGSYAAVAIVLRNLETNPEVILVKRAARRDDPWSGQIAFPGGRRKPSDQNLVQTALRELEEETGVGGDAVEFLGSLPYVSPANSPNLLVKPFVGLLTGEAVFVEGSEVQKVFWAPLLGLKPVVKRVYSKSGRWVSKHLCYAYGDELVWGMTSKLLKQVLTRVGL